MSQARVLDRSAWKSEAAFERWEAEARRMAAEMRRTTGRRDVGSFAGWLRVASPGWPWHFAHLKAIRRALRRVERGETTRLMIFLHPRSFKSQMVTVRWPAYLLERDPLTRVIVGSYNQSLADSFSHETRRIVTERGVELDPKRQMVDEWLTAAGGGMKAVGVGAGVTGRGANCFTGDTPVLTEKGYIPIAELHRMEARPGVVSLDEGMHNPNICAILASRESEAYELVEITTGAGRRIRCTLDHRIYTRQSGYKEAGLLRAGDELLAYGLSDLRRAEVGQGSEVLLSLLRGTTQANGDTDLWAVRTDVRETRLRAREGDSAGIDRDVLQPGLRPVEPSRLLGGAAAVQALRPASTSTERQILLGRVQGVGPAGAAGSLDDCASPLPRMWCRFSGSQLSSPILLQSVRESGAQQAHERGGELPFQRRDELCQVVHVHETVDSGEGRRQVLPVRDGGHIGQQGVAGSAGCAIQSTYSPHRREPRQQRAGEPGDTVPAVPYRAPQEAKRSWDAVARIRRIRTGGVKVYDLQVDRSHNFLAGDILAHNCLILDDPVKSAAEVRSHAYRERVWNWWQNDLITRLEPHPRDGRPPAIILIMTRWSDDDLAGRILAGETGHEWDVLRIPALAETQDERDDYNRSVGRPAGERDPLGREPGEAMNPERFDVADLEAKRAEMGLLGFMALYQQRPTAPEGDMFRREWFEIVTPEQFALLISTAKTKAAVRYWDKAGSTSKASAYSAGVLVALLDGTYYIAHLVMGKWEAAEREAVILQTAAADFAAWGYAVENVVEQEGGSGGKESAVNSIRALAGAGYRAAADRPTGDKALRAEPVAVLASVGRVRLVAGPWNRDYLDILAAFPGGAIKDAVDATSGGFARLSAAEVKKPASGKPVVVGRDDMFGV